MTIAIPSTLSPRFRDTALISLFILEKKKRSALPRSVPTSAEPPPRCLLPRTDYWNNQIHRKLALEMVLEDQEAAAAAAEAEKEEGTPLEKEEVEAVPVSGVEAEVPAEEEGGEAAAAAAADATATTEGQEDAAEAASEERSTAAAERGAKAWVVTTENLDKVRCDAAVVSSVGARNCWLVGW